jgi:peptide/nickel transport system permease protein
VTIPDTKPSELIPAAGGLMGSVAVESGGALGELEPVRARGYWEQVWRRLRKDKVALAGGIAIIVLVFSAFVGGPIAASILGHGPNDAFFGAGNQTLTPLGPWTWVANEGATAHGKTLFILGSDDPDLNRDEFLRLLYGAQVSLEVAVGATIIGIVIGVLMGAMAGYFRGWIDVIVSRLTEIVMAFPYLLFVVALASTVGQRLDNVTLGFLQPGVVALVLVLGLFSWYYPARIVRALVLSLREKEFVEAARMTGASDTRIIRSHILPHLVGPVIVYSTLIVAQNVLAEAGLSFLGLGIPVSTASWGNLLQTATPFYTLQPWVMVWPGLAVLFTTLAFNLFGDGLRDAFDPRSNR